MKTLGASSYLRLDLRQLRHRLHFCQHPDTFPICLLYTLYSTTFTLSLSSPLDLINTHECFKLLYLSQQVHWCHDMCDGV